MRAATGVPVAEAFSHMALQDAAVRAAALVALAVAATAAAQRGVWLLAQRVDAALDREAGEPPARQPSTLSMVLGAALVAVQRPAQAVLPWFTFSFCSTVVAALAQVAAAELRAGGPGASASRVAAACQGPAARALMEAAQLMQDTAEFSAIVFA
jgi:hypothetical protein